MSSTENLAKYAGLVRSRILGENLPLYFSRLAQFLNYLLKVILIPREKYSKWDPLQKVETMQRSTDGGRQPQWTYINRYANEEGVNSPRVPALHRELQVTDS